MLPFLLAVVGFGVNSIVALLRGGALRMPGDLPGPRWPGERQQEEPVLQRLLWDTAMAGAGIGIPFGWLAYHAMHGFAL
jgi:hypothetical protein